MNRGSQRGQRSGSSGDARFNEAPIHESGKYLLRMRTRRRQARFNEAPIHESGK